MSSQRLPLRIANRLGRLAERFGRGPARFRDAEASLFETARRATGLDDFGDDAYLPHLRALLAAYDEEAGLNPVGRWMTRQMLVGILESRLRVQRAWRDDPALLERPIARPLFILGFPRSGTTALHFLLAQDPANQVLEYWLAAAPGPRPPRDEWERDARFRKAANALRFSYWLDPGLEAIHSMTPEGPDECRHLFLQSFLDDTFDSNATLPSYTKWFAAQDMRPAYERHRDVLKLVQSSSPERRWVLKYPAHMRRLELLLETYPDACIVQTHRDPVQVLPSLCSLVARWRGIYEDAVDLHAVGRWQLDMWSGIFAHGARVRSQCDPARFLDLEFDAFRADPIAAVRRIYAHFGSELGADAEARMRAWVDANPEGRHGEHRYCAEDFGISAGEITDRFRGC